MTAEVVMAKSPERVVASPYVGRKNGSIVIMKMPKPKPVVRCTKLAPMLNRNMAITRLLIIFYFQFLTDIKVIVETVIILVHDPKTSVG